MILCSYGARSDSMTKVIDFTNPPVIEVVCGASFDKLSAFKAPHIGAFWKTLPKEFSQVDEQLPIMTPGDTPEILTALPHPRSWFLTEDGRQLVQLQQNRILYNWKHPDHKEGEEYPEFKNILPKFFRFVDLLRSFVSEEGLGKIEFHQFELTYVNHVPSSSVRGQLERYSDVLIDHVRDSSRKRFLPEPVAFNWITSYDMPNGSGRLHVSAQSAKKKTDDRGNVLRLDLTARGVGADTSEEGMKAWFVVAHDQIVRGFADITDQTVQNEVWERKR